MSTPLTDPYAGGPEEEKTRFVSRMHTTDYNYLRGLLLDRRSTVQLIVNNLTKSYIETLRKHGITNYTELDRALAILESEYPPAGRAPADNSRNPTVVPGRGRPAKHGGPSPRKPVKRTDA